MAARKGLGFAWVSLGPFAPPVLCFQSLVGFVWQFSFFSRRASLGGRGASGGGVPGLRITPARRAGACKGGPVVENTGEIMSCRRVIGGGASGWMAVTKPLRRGRGLALFCDLGLGPLSGFRVVDLFGLEDGPSAGDGAVEAGIAAGIKVEQARVIGQPAEGASPEHGRCGGGIESALAAVLGVEGVGLGAPQAPLLPMSGGHDLHGGDGERGFRLVLRLNLVEDLGEIVGRFAVDDEVAGILVDTTVGGECVWQW